MDAYKIQPDRIPLSVQSYSRSTRGRLESQNKTIRIQYIVPAGNFVFYCSLKKNKKKQKHTLKTIARQYTKKTTPVAGTFLPVKSR